MERFRLSGLVRVVEMSGDIDVVDEVAQEMSKRSFVPVDHHGIDKVPQ